MFKKSTFSDKLFEAAENLPDYVQAMPGYPGKQLVLPENIIFYYRCHQKPSNIFLHDRFVLLYVISGKTVIEIDQVDYSLCQGQILLVFPGKAHRTKPVPEDEGRILHISFSLPGELTNWMVLQDVTFSADRRMRQMLLKMTEDFAANWQQNRGSAQTLAYSFGEFLELLRWHAVSAVESGEGISLPDAASDCRNKELAGRISDYCFRNLDRQVSIEELAQKLSASAGNLRLCFRKFTGISLGRYIRNCRLHHATALLSNSGLSIKEIAERCGYASAASFCRAYKHESGMSPQEFRRRKI